jgi:hypothetical protein
MITNKAKKIDNNKKSISKNKDGYKTDKIQISHCHTYRNNKNKKIIKMHHLVTNYFSTTYDIILI